MSDTKIVVDPDFADVPATGNFGIYTYAGGVGGKVELCSPAKIVFESFDVVFTEIISGLYLDKD